MIIKLFDKSTDYETVKTWWLAQNWPAVPESSLSTTGFIIKEGDQSLLSGWVYHTNSDIAWLEFIVANPEIKGEQRDEAFELFFSFVLNYAKIKNYKNVFTSVQHQGLMKRLEKNGFKKGDENMTNFIRSL